MKARNAYALTRPILRAASAIALVLAVTHPAVAQTTPPVVDSAGLAGWFDEVFHKTLSPWFWFGMTAQFVFFMRFVVQWIVSEKRRRSTVPVAFWYLSIVGSLALLVYAAHERDPVIMAGQLLACVIYVRNLMLISDWRKRRLQAGLPVNETDDAQDSESVASKPAR